MAGFTQGCRRHHSCGKDGHARESEWKPDDLGLRALSKHTQVVQTILFVYRDFEVHVKQTNSPSFVSIS